MHDGGFAAAGSRLLRGRILGVDPCGLLRVEIGGVEALAETVVAVCAADMGAEAVVAEVGASPVVLGLIRRAVPEAELDGTRLVLEGRREVVLRCGRASITLAPDGRVTIRGTEILSRASGANRIQGASVQLN
ncbi:hypothetical protein [Cereibacter sphaeroides]|jgi:hypothetical protein|uniref:hypothetical protein n=1 Tax=Cereibacter sphaeroides TaxID=1063 RepID=UPI0000664CBA|nr:conserved hypothetical protein [Cereibacter sphaeroides ATCC 17029]